MAKSYILLLQKVAQRQLLALGEGFREERCELSLQDHSLLDREAIAHSHTEIGYISIILGTTPYSPMRHIA